MKKVLALVALAAFAGSAYAQLNPVPPKESPAITIKALVGSENETNWSATPGLGSYKFVSDATLGAPKPGTPDNAVGLNWAATSTGVSLHLSNLSKEGGTVRFIFLGESAGWLNDVGYSYSGIPTASDSYSLFNNIQAPGNPTFGDSADIGLGAGVSDKFDFWFNGVGEMGSYNPVPPTLYGGYYTPFHQTNSSPYNAPGNFMISDALSVTTWAMNDDLTAFIYRPVNTYLVSVEDWNLKAGSDKDYNDFMFAVQFFDKNGRPDNPVPEPSTYGLIGAAALVGLVAARRFMSKKA
jgi:hypothetical protein